MPFEVTRKGWNSNPVTTIISAGAGLTGIIMASKQAYGPMREAFTPTVDSFDPHADLTIWGGKIAAGLVCAIIASLVYSLVVWGANQIKNAFDAACSSDFSSSPKNP
jgi:hypothetical protein